MRAAMVTAEKIVLFEPKDFCENPNSTLSGYS